MKNWKEIGGEGIAPYEGTAGVCVNELTVNASILKRRILSRFPSAEINSSLNCRANTANPSTQSLHGDGRALDVYGSTKLLEEICLFLLMENKERIQYLVFDGFSVSAKRSGAYGGPDPHLDHLHVEVPRDRKARESPRMGNSSDFLPIVVLIGLLYLWSSNG